MITLTGKYTTAKVMIDDIDDSCREQIETFINHPAFTNPVYIMPDTHAGSGCVIGFTMEMPDMIIPNCVGVDVGCSMLSINIGKEVYSRLSKEELDRAIRAVVPFGFSVNNNAAHDPNQMNWAEVQKTAERFASSFNAKFGTKIEPPTYDYDWYRRNCAMIGADFSRVVRSIGSLGGGK